MAELLSQRKLQNLYSKEIRGLSESEVKNRVREKRVSEETPSFSNLTIFLSHSHKDKLIVEKIGLLFSKLSIDLYVDWLDVTLPQETNHMTALKIKEKIERCNKFLFLATYFGVRSKWCNWEIGIADSSKGSQNIAILPIASYKGNWAGNEYLDIYSELQIESQDLGDLNINDITVSTTSGESIAFYEWIQT